MYLDSPLMSLVLLQVLLALLCALCVKSFMYYSYWKKKGVESPFWPIPILGNAYPVVLMQKCFGEFYLDLYFRTKKRLPYFGIYSVRGPTIVIKDFDLIKNILTKDFLHFSDHNKPMDENRAPMQLHLFNLTGEKWKQMRVRLTPTFTTAKMRYMFDTVAACNGEMLSYLQKTISANHQSPFDMKELFATLNTDVIGSCAFGIDCNSFRDPDSKFRKMGKKVFEFPVRLVLLRYFALMFPALFSKYVPDVEKELETFFHGLVGDTIKHREDNKVSRSDFLQLLIDQRKEDTPPGKEAQQDDGTRLTTMQIAAQVFVFFIAGFETSSTTASFAMYELALNPDIQDRLREEIDQVLERHNGEVTYDALGEMTYLSLVIDETLRKYPPLAVLFRICTKDYAIPGTEITIEKDTPVMIPILGIQRDPDIYPDPMKFDPERFTPENKATRNHFSYMPFGEGPRICIGSRFGVMQTKLALVSVLSQYTVSPCTKTLIPMKYDSKSFILAADGGMWLNLSPRNLQQ